MNTEYFNKQNESGRTMVEMVGVVALMGLITAAAFVLVRSGLQTQKISRIADEIDTLASNARALSAEKDNFSSLPLETDIYSAGVYKGNVLANRILNKAADYTTAIGGDYYLVKSNADGTNGFKVLIKGITSAGDCEMIGAYSFTDASASCAGNNLTVTYLK